MRVLQLPAQRAAERHAPLDDQENRSRGGVENAQGGEFQREYPAVGVNFSDYGLQGGVDGSRGIN